MRDYHDSLEDLFNGLAAQIFVEKPCKVVNVNSQYSVDIEYYGANGTDYLYNVPVKHLQTQRSYVYLGISSGDRGTVRFLDEDVSAYVNSTIQKYPDLRTHDINDNLFCLGFYPSESRYIFPTGDLVIGTTSGAVINLTADGISITGADVTINSSSSVTINSSSVEIGSDVTIDGKKFLEHTHSNGNQGAPTGGVI